MLTTELSFVCSKKVFGEKTLRFLQRWRDKREEGRGQWATLEVPCQTKRTLIRSHLFRKLHAITEKDIQRHSTI